MGERVADLALLSPLPSSVAGSSDKLNSFFLTIDDKLVPLGVKSPCLLAKVKLFSKSDTEVLELSSASYLTTEVEEEMHVSNCHN